MPSTTQHDRDRVTEINSQYHDAIADKYEKRFEAFSPEVLGWIRRMFEREAARSGTLDSYIAGLRQDAGSKPTGEPLVSA